MIALIGVDVGTTNIKTIAYTTTGQILAEASIPTRVYYPRPGWAYFEPAELWDTTAQTIQQVTHKLPTGYTPAGIAVTSMAETAIPIDAHGQPAYVAIAWFDRRTQKQAEWWQHAVGNEIVNRITGLPVQPIFGINKIMWLRDHEPDVYRRIACWLNVADYIAFRLCGVPATDYSLASRMMVLDLVQRQWSADLLRTANVPRTLLADLVPSGTRLGGVLPEVAPFHRAA